jgi:hypothetical protein
MTNQPIAPPPELVQQWREAPEFSALSPCVMVTVTNTKLQDIATQAAQWGSDQELEACWEWLEQNCDQWKLPYSLRAARRPKPPSLKEQALTALHAIATGANDTREQHQDFDTIRQALEQLDD